MLIPRSSFLTSKLWRSDILILGTNHTPLLFWLKAALPGADHIIFLFRSKNGYCTMSLAIIPSADRPIIGVDQIPRAGKSGRSINGVVRLTPVGKNEPPSEYTVRCDSRISPLVRRLGSEAPERTSMLLGSKPQPLSLRSVCCFPPTPACMSKPQWN